MTPTTKKATPSKRGRKRKKPTDNPKKSNKRRKTAAKAEPKVAEPKMSPYGSEWVEDSESDTSSDSDIGILTDQEGYESGAPVLVGFGLKRKINDKSVVAGYAATVH